MCYFSFFYPFSAIPLNFLSSFGVRIAFEIWLVIETRGKVVKLGSICCLKKKSSGRDPILYYKGANTKGNVKGKLKEKKGDGKGKFIEL